MRTILVLFMLLIFFIVTFPAFLVLKLIGRFNPKACAYVSQKFIKVGFRMVLWAAGAKVTVKGVENIPKDRACLFTSNHRSYVDVPLGYISVPGITGFVAKKEIKKVPFLSWWMTNLNCLFIDRENLRQSLQIILEAIEKVNNGVSVFIMPEGTRNQMDELLPFKEGSFKIAEKSGCPVVPVAISNTDAVYEKHRPWVHKAKVVIHYGQPIYTENMTKEDKKALVPKVMDEIRRMLKEDKELTK
ncbi:MAG: 1-acyl-sn-glycerol-3-phosphate acyltransferase [Lachnospiraceae bacterium]|nr:1-acyl-sn-glycerol-3-phosphate acyltransferase [Lachnospiraceae bacterium]